jgi:NitT/TauT family transport system permease protein
MVASVGRRARRREARIAWGLRLLTFAVFAGFWQLAAGRMDNALIPTFAETVRGLYRLFTDGQLWGPLLVSNQAMLLGFAIAVIVGIPWGLLAGRFRLLDRVSNPYVGILLAVPIAPLIPIVITALGLGLASRVLIVVLFSFIFIAVNTRAGVRNVDSSLTEMARSFGANERQTWWGIVLPSALPAIFAGLRIGLGRSIAGMVLVELLLVATGVGRLVLDFTGRLEADLLFATVTAVVLEALLLLSAMRMLERRIAPWARDTAVR